MNKPLPLLLLVVLASVSYADSIDDAEAKSRGVPVLQVQLEKVQKQLSDADAANVKLLQQLASEGRKADAKIADAEKRAAEAKARADEATARAQKAEAELATIKGELSPAEKVKIDAAEKKRQEVADAIKSHKIVNGMTLDEVKKAFPDSPPRLISEDRRSQTYQVSYTTYGIGMAGSRNVQTVGTGSFFFDMQEGKVTSWSNGPTEMEPAGVPGIETN